VAHDRVGELRERADAGHDDARRWLAFWLATNDGLAELRQRRTPTTTVHGSNCSGGWLITNPADFEPA